MSTYLGRYEVACGTLWVPMGKLLKWLSIVNLDAQLIYNYVYIQWYILGKALYIKQYNIIIYILSCLGNVLSIILVFHCIFHKSSLRQEMLKFIELWVIIVISASVFLLLFYLFSLPDFLKLSRILECWHRSWFLNFRIN